MSSTVQATRSHHARRAPTVNKVFTAQTTRGKFAQFCSLASNWLGSKWSFTAAIFIVVVWAATGPIFHYSNTWQLVINTGTTIVTFLMVFLIQNTQNRDAQAINLKTRRTHPLYRCRQQSNDGHREPERQRVKRAS